MIISQVAPSPSDASLPVVREYQAALKTAAAPEPPSYVTLEGYITGRVLVAALEKAGREVTREKVVDAIDSMQELDLGGIKVGFSPANHQGSSAVFLTRVEGGKAQPLALK